MSFPEITAVFYNITFIIVTIITLLYIIYKIVYETAKNVFNSGNRFLAKKNDLIDQYYLGSVFIIIISSLFIIAGGYYFNPMLNDLGGFALSGDGLGKFREYQNILNMWLSAWGLICLDLLTFIISFVMGCLKIIQIKEIYAMQYDRIEFLISKDKKVSNTTKWIIIISFIFGIMLYLHSDFVYVLQIALCSLIIHILYLLFFSAQMRAFNDEMKASDYKYIEIRNNSKKKITGILINKDDLLITILSKDGILSFPLNNIKSLEYMSWNDIDYKAFWQSLCNVGELYRQIVFEELSCVYLEHVNFNKEVEYLNRKLISGQKHWDKVHKKSIRVRNQFNNINRLLLFVNNIINKIRRAKVPKFLIIVLSIRLGFVEKLNGFIEKRIDFINSKILTNEDEYKQLRSKIDKAAEKQKAIIEKVEFIQKLSGSTGSF